MFQSGIDTDGKARGCLTEPITPLIECCCDSADKRHSKIFEVPCFSMFFVNISHVWTNYFTTTEMLEIAFFQFEIPDVKLFGKFQILLILIF